MSEAADIPNLNMLREAVDSVPPNIAAARLALQGAGAEMKQSEDRQAYSAEVAQLVGRIASAARRKAVIAEFTGYANTYQALADVFGGESLTEPTHTEGKRQNGGKDNPNS